MRGACVLVCRLLFRIDVNGLANLPRAADGRAARGWIAAGVPHRNWVEPLLLAAVLPARLRLVGIADGPTISRSLLRRLLIRAVGGAIPVWPRSGPAGFEAIAQATGGVIETGAVVAIFPETGPPAKEPGLRRLSAGVAHLAARTRAPVVPIVFGGTHDLYLRRHIVVTVLPRFPPPTSDGRADIAAFVAEFRARSEAAAVEAHRDAESSSPRRKRWRWLTGRYPRV